MAVAINSIVFGLFDKPLPLKGFPDGRCRIRMRPDDLVAVYVKTTGGIREFRVKEEDGFWVPFGEVARNITS